MSSRTRSRRRFRRSVFQLFLLYAVIIPVIFYALDKQTFLRLARRDTFLFCIELAGAAFIIALIISTWSKRDPELQKW
jgi:ABC-type spermidine/putrescine transport system permease subunit II